MGGCQLPCCEHFPCGTLGCPNSASTDQQSTFPSELPPPSGLAVLSETTPAIGASGREQPPTAPTAPTAPIDEQMGQLQSSPVFVQPTVPQFAQAPEITPSSSQMDVPPPPPPPPPYPQVVETGSGPPPPQGPQQGSGRAPHVEDYPPPGHRPYAGEDLGDGRYCDPLDSNMIYIPIRSEMGIKASRECYPDDDYLNNSPTHLRVNRRYVGDFNDPAPPPPPGRRRVRRCDTDSDRFNSRLGPFTRWHSLPSRARAGFWRRDDHPIPNERRHDDHPEPNERRRRDHPGGPIERRRDDHPAGGPNERRRRDHPEPNEGRRDDHPAGGPNEGGAEHPAGGPNEGGAEHPAGPNEGRQEPGTLVYDNVIIGDPTRVRIGEGNRGGRKTGGRVSGNIVVR